MVVKERLRFSEGSKEERAKQCQDIKRADDQYARDLDSGSLELRKRR